MSLPGSTWREVGERLRQRYAKSFKVLLQEVVRLDIEGDRCMVYAPLRTDLPVWATDGPPLLRKILDMLVRDQGLMRGSASGDSATFTR